MQVLANAATALAKKGEALPIETLQSFRDACLAGAKLFGWDGRPEVNVAVSNQVVTVTDAERARLIALRNEALAAPSEEDRRLNDASLTYAQRNELLLAQETQPVAKPAPAPVQSEPQQGMTDFQRFEAYKRVEEEEPDPYSVA